ncbi:MAG: CoA pyrophosphatase [Polyangiales bacterium]
MGPLPSYDLAAIAERLHRVDAGPHHEAELPRAAVAVLLRAPTVRDEAEVFFIERAVRAGDPWSGHMAFPGGRRDPGDVDLHATAVRETREEVGIDLERDATLIARLPDLPAVLKTAGIGIVVSPYVFALQRPVEAAPNHEVAGSLWTPIGPLARGELRGTYAYPVMGKTMEFPCHRLGDKVVWGLTWQMLDGLFSRLHAD